MPEVDTLLATSLQYLIRWVFNIYRTMTPYGCFYSAFRSYHQIVESIRVIQAPRVERREECACQYVQRDSLWMTTLHKW